jgi:uncharacterized membrane protein
MVEPPLPIQVADLVDRDGDCRGIIQLGLVLLIATPVRWAAERDRTYMIMTAIVLAIRLLSLIGRI